MSVPEPTAATAAAAAAATAARVTPSLAAAPTVTAAATTDAVEPATDADAAAARPNKKARWTRKDTRGRMTRRDPAVDHRSTRTNWLRAEKDGVLGGSPSPSPSAAGSDGAADGATGGAADGAADDAVDGETSAAAAPETAAPSGRTGGPKRKVALLMSYCGTGFSGMQVNPGQFTIEGELHRALAETGAVSADNAYCPDKYNFMRAARTDKGVHAAGTIVSLKMLMGDPQIVSKLNAALPPQIRVWQAIRTNNGFHAKNNTDSRVYEYLLPTYTLAPAAKEIFTESGLPEAGPEVQPLAPLSWAAYQHFVDRGAMDTAGDPDAASDTGSDAASGATPAQSYRNQNIPHLTPTERATLHAYRVPPAILARFREMMDLFKGTHTFHNFTTTDMSHTDRASRRHLLDIQVSAPFERRVRVPRETGEVKGDPERAAPVTSAAQLPYEPEVEDEVPDDATHHTVAVEWVRITLHGQSFMLHQIRKMVGMALMATRTHCPPALVEACFAPMRLNLPQVPGLGLLLQETVHGAYNRQNANPQARPKGAKRGAPDGAEVREPIVFDAHRDAITAFKARWIDRSITRIEATRCHYGAWLRVVDAHAFRESRWIYQRSGVPDPALAPAYMQAKLAAVARQAQQAADRLAAQKAQRDAEAKASAAIVRDALMPVKSDALETAAAPIVTGAPAPAAVKLEAAAAPAAPAAVKLEAAAAPAAPAATIEATLPQPAAEPR